MDTQELIQLVENEHKRDIKLTLLNYGLILLTIVAVVVLVKLFGSSELINDYFKNLVNFFYNDKNGTYFSIVVVILVVGSILYFCYKTVKLFKKKKVIDLFFKQIEAQKIATHISEFKVYKIIIPLIKIKLNLCPVDYLRVVFEGGIKPFEIPVRQDFLPELKIFLSGKNPNQVSKNWFEMANISNENTQKEYPLKSESEFQTFLETELKDTISEVESGRKKDLTKIVLFGSLSAIIAIGWLFFQNQLMQGKINISPQQIVIGFVVVSIAFYLFFFLFQKLGNRKSTTEMRNASNYDSKMKILRRIIEFINPEFNYLIHGHISTQEFIGMGFFRPENYTVTGNDQIIGSHKGIPFQLCDLDVSKVRNFSRENSAPDEVFLGQVFIAQFNKSLKSDVFVIPKKMESIFSKGDSNLYFDNLGDKVTLEDPEFMKLFSVYAKDQVEARYVLSTSVIQRIKDYSKKSKGKLLLSFKGSRICIANYSRENNFETSVFTSLSHQKITSSFYNVLKTQLEVIEDLNLNVKIWKPF